MEYRVELRTVTSPDEVRLEDDPVRRGLDYHFRMTNGRRIFTIPEKAVVCTANTSQLPTTMNELEKYSDSNADEFTIFYTVWSYEKGYGRLILNYLLPLLNSNRYVTLSPKTEMAKRFHLRNGAKIQLTNSFLTKCFVPVSRLIHLHLKPGWQGVCHTILPDFP